MTKKESEECLCDEQAKSIAIDKLNSNPEMKIPLSKIQFYAAYIRGLQSAYDVLFKRMIVLAKRSEKPYLQAEYNLIMSNVNALYDYHTGKYNVRYRNHINDKKGKLIKCEAYMTKGVQLDVEVKYNR